MYGVPVACSVPSTFTLAALRELHGIFTALYFGGKFSERLKLSGFKPNFSSTSLDFSICFEILRNAYHFMKE